MTFSTAFDNALIVASLAHRGQVRKGTRVPYVMHPFHVSALLARFGYGEPLTVAALLHDVLEDMPFGDHALQADLAATFPQRQWPRDADDDAFKTEVERFLLETFGADVVRLVRAVTEQKSDSRGKRLWIERRQQQLDHLASAAADEATLKAADALHNASSILQDITAGRATLERRFNASPQQTVWYYQEVARLARQRTDAVAIIDALDEAVQRLREWVTAREPSRD